MKTIGEQIRALRNANKMPLRKLASLLEIDQSVLSKIERGKRRVNREQVLKIAGIFKVDEKELLVAYLSDRILYELKDEELAKDALQAAERVIKYGNQ